MSLNQDKIMNTHSKSPEILGPEEIRTYQVYLTNEKKLATSSILIAICALRFLYKVTLKKNWVLEEIISRVLIRRANHPAPVAHCSGINHKYCNVKATILRNNSIH